MEVQKGSRGQMGGRQVVVVVRTRTARTRHVQQQKGLVNSHILQARRFVHR